MLSRGMTSNAQELITLYLKQLSKKDLIAVDGTLGNGYDLEFLASQKAIRKIYGFDIQEEAVWQCRDKIKNSDKEIQLIADSHEAIDHYVEEKIDLALFNLGYLPGGNKEIVTKVDSSLHAIKKTLNQLSDEGIIAIMTYPGHEEGKKEHEAIKEFLKGCQFKELSILNLAVVNVKKECPELFLIIKSKIE